MEYNLVSLEDICLKITDGAHHSPKADTEGYPMYSVKDMQYNKFDNNGAKLISEVDYLKLVKQGCRPDLNDIVIAKDGSYLKHVFVVTEKIEAVLLSSIAILRPDLEKVNPDYLSYYLKQNSVKDHLENGFVSGSVLPRIILKDFRKYKIKLPSLEIQNKTVEVLKYIDLKIQNNNDLITNLEELSQTLFKRWFVDFEFPDENGNPYKSSGGSMKESDLGKIPTEWTSLIVSDICKINKKNLSKDSNINYINYLDTGSITKNTISSLTYIDLTTEKQPSRAKRIVNKNDIVYSTVRPNQEHYGLLRNIEDNMIVSTGFAVLSSQIDNYAEILYLWLTQDKVTNYLQTIAEGNTSAYPSISPKDIGEIKVVLPSVNKIEELSPHFIKYYNQVSLLQNENNYLVNLRETLLPKLMSGEIELADDSEVNEHEKLLQ